MRRDGRKLLGLVVVLGLVGVACDDDKQSSTSNPSAATTEGSRATAAPPADDEISQDDQDNFDAAAVAVADGFWERAIESCNELSRTTGGVVVFDGGPEDPTVDTGVGDPVSQDVFELTDRDDVVLLIDISNFTVTGPEGPEGIMPRPYSLVCPQDVFLGRFDEDGMMAGEELYLQGDGLGIVDFGTEPESAISMISDALGQPAADTGWIDASSAWGSCPGTQVRVVRWFDLEALFTDVAETFDTKGDGPHFFNWQVPNLNGDGERFDFATRSDIELGSTIGDLQAAYGGDVAIDFDPDAGQWRGFVTAGVDKSLIAELTDSEPDGVVTKLQAGGLCFDEID